MKNNMVRAISQNGGMVVCAVDSTELVREMERIHHTSAVVSAGLGRLLTAASLMGSWLKDSEDSLTLRIDGGGPASPLVAVADGNANVRGYATAPVVEIALRADGKLDVGGAVGREGTLSVIKDLGLKEPYIGQIPLVSGEVGEDVTAYYAASEQTPTVCALGVLVNKDLSIRCAGGFLLQLLPGASDEEITHLEENIRSMPAVTELLDAGKTPWDIAQYALAGYAPELLEERTVAYQCHCTREKTRDILFSLGRQELETMLAEDPVARVECHFCNKSYQFDINELLAEMDTSGKSDSTSAS